MRFFAASIFLLGAGLIAWLALGFAASSSLALLVTLVIAAAYAVGALELWGFQRDTGRLQQALQPAQPEPSEFEHWLAQLPTTLRSPVARRIQGEPAALPGPLLTPYLSGLLVMLGLLGTFIGMMIALQGAVSALEGSTELAAIRAGLTAPIKGLSMAFGTSVGGVAASAVLGLLSTMARRQRLAVARDLDVRGVQLFPGRGPRHHNEQMLQEARAQTAQLPALAAQVEALVTRVDTATDSLHSRMLEGQQGLQHQLLELHSGLLAHVGQSLRESFADSGRQAGESMAPLLREALQAMAAQTDATQSALRGAVADQLNALQAVREQVAQTVASTRSLVSAQASAVTAQDSLREALQATVTDSRTLLEAQSTSAATLLQQLGEQLTDHRQRLQQEWLAERRRFDEQLLARIETQATTVEDALTRALAANAQLTVDTLQPLIASSMAGLDRAVASVREESGAALQRDQALLDAQRGLVAELHTAASALAEDAAQYRSTLEAFSEHTRAALASTGAEFVSTVGAQTDRLAEVTGQFGSAAQELVALGEALGSAVAQFDSVAQRLADTLQHTARGMEEAAGRSDEQLAYYVAQAREVIDHSALAQQKLLDQLREISRSV